MQNLKFKPLFLYCMSAGLLVALFSLQAVSQGIIAKDQDTGLLLTETHTRAVFETVDLIRKKEEPINYRLQIGITLLAAETFRKEPEKTLKILDALTLLLQSGKILGFIDEQKGMASDSKAVSASGTESSEDFEKVWLFLSKIIRLVETVEQSDLLKSERTPSKNNKLSKQGKI